MMLCILLCVRQSEERTTRPPFGLTPPGLSSNRTRSEPNSVSKGGGRMVNLYQHTTGIRQACTPSVSYAWRENAGSKLPGGGSDYMPPAASGPAVPRSSWRANVVSSPLREIVRFRHSACWGSPRLRAVHGTSAREVAASGFSSSPRSVVGGGGSPGVAHTPCPLKVGPCRASGVPSTSLRRTCGYRLS